MSARLSSTAAARSGTWGSLIALRCAEHGPEGEHPGREDDQRDEREAEQARGGDDEAAPGEPPGERAGAGEGGHEACRRERRADEQERIADRRGPAGEVDEGLVDRVRPARVERERERGRDEGGCGREVERDEGRAGGDRG